MEFKPSIDAAKRSFFCVLMRAAIPASNSAKGGSLNKGEKNLPQLYEKHKITTDRLTDRSPYILSEKSSGS